MTSRPHDPYVALPDPATQPEFYAGVTIKRVLAWLVDTVIVGLIAAVAASLPLFLLWFIFPLVFLAVSLVYRIGAISAFSATPGMLLFNIELRTHLGAKLNGTEAALHTVTFLVASAFMLPQLASMALMLMNPRGQGLHDLFCGTVAINTPARH